MGQLLVMLTVPPIVGVVAYIIARRLWELEENSGSEIIERHDPSAGTPADTMRTDI